MPARTLRGGRTAAKRAIARELGISRDTIHRPIRTGELDRDLDGEPVRYRAPRGGGV